MFFARSVPLLGPLASRRPFHFFRPRFRFSPSLFNVVDSWGGVREKKVCIKVVRPRVFESDSLPSFHRPSREIREECEKSMPILYVLFASSSFLYSCSFSTLGGESLHLPYVFRVLPDRFFQTDCSLSPHPHCLGREGDGVVGLTLCQARNCCGLRTL